MGHTSPSAKFLGSTSSHHGVVVFSDGTDAFPADFAIVDRVFPSQVLLFRPSAWFLLVGFFGTICASAQELHVSIDIALLDV